MDYFEYKMPTQGLGTDFSQSERPLTFAEVYTNRFRNVTGGAQRRPGMSRFSLRINGNPTLTRLHESTGTTGAVNLFTSDDFGNIWRYNTSGNNFDSVLTGKSQVRMISAQAEDFLIFVNGVDRNFYTKDGGNTFNELKAIITTGKTAGGTTPTNVVDGNISNWISQTLVSNNDIIYNATQNGYGIVSTVASAALTITAIGSAGNGAGKTTFNQTSGDAYELLDYVNLEIFSDGAGGTTDVATAGSGTTTTVIAVSGVDFSTTEIRRNDIVYNTTRSALALVGSVSANVNLLQTITGQISGDALAFFKSAMPIASQIHVHYGRVYYLDSRNQTRIVISAPDDPQDVTTYQQTLDSTSFSFGTQQPTGDIILAMSSFQQFFVAAGQKNLYIYQGITPIADSSSTTVNFTPVSFYPNGVAGRFGLGTNGTDLQHITKEGLQNINIGSNVSNTTLQTNLSLPIRSAVINLIQGANTDNIQYSFYPRRSWLMMKISDNIYVLNTNPSYSESGQLTQFSQSWHLFSGPWAQQNHYFVRRNGDLLACGAGGLVYSMDASAATDDGSPITTDLMTAWLRLEEPQASPRVKQGQYIRPIFESAPDIGYTINVVAGWDGLSRDSIVVSAGATGAIGSAIIGINAIGEGAYAQADKYPLRWRGEQARIEFITQSSASPDVITGFYVYGDLNGVR